jgi:SulP family sulfate permease
MVLIRQGDPPNGIYFLESGQLTVQVDSPAGPIRVRSIGEGTVVGELGLYLNRVTTASVIVTQPGLAYFLPGELLDDIEQNDPQAAIALHRLIVQVVGERLIFNMNTLQALNS